MELGRPLATITPTLDGDVLAVLARSEVTFTTGQIHRILTRNSEEGIRKVLLRLVKQGVVHSDRVGNAFTYRLNRDHLAAEYIIGLAGLQGKLLKRIEDRLAAWQLPPVYAADDGAGSWTHCGWNSCLAQQATEKRVGSACEHSRAMQKSVRVACERRKASWMQRM